jgi:hypothetical protein
MPMIAVMTAAEIAAAEAAAIAAAEAAAATAATEAAAVTAAEAAAAQAAQAAAAQAAQAGIAGAQAAGAGTTGAGIMAQAVPAVETATAVGGPGAGSAGIQQAMQSATQSAGAAPGGITTAPTPAGTAPPISQGSLASQLQLEANAAAQLPSQATSSGITSSTGGSNAPLLNDYNEAYSLTDTAPNYSQLQLPPGAAPEAGYEVAGQGGPKWYDKALEFAKENKFLTGAAAYTAAYNLGLLDPRGMEMPKKSYGNQYTLSKDFKASEATPNVYKPTYQTYAEGGVMAVGGPSSEVPEPRKSLNPMTTVSAETGGEMPGYAKGGTLSSSLDYYRQMTEGQSAKAAPDKGNVGIYYDQDLDTRYQDALTAAQIRQAKVNKRANLRMPTGGVMKRATPMGQINLAPPGSKAQDSGDATEAAQGGIMQARDSSLGGYAAGGNPRLLKGPGDGMSDNIPAMIGRKQPARLADGEFVIPADVVSHLGNGSTEAGAKRLHEMMTKVRRERTGNPKQGKQINPRKFMPK